MEGTGGNLPLPGSKVSNYDRHKVLAIEKHYEDVMFKSPPWLLACRMEVDGTIKYCNKRCRELLPGRIGDNIMKDIDNPAVKERIKRGCKLFSPDKPIIIHIDCIFGMTIRWYNKAIFDDEGKIIEFEGIGRVLEE